MMSVHHDIHGWHSHDEVPGYVKWIPLVVPLFALYLAALIIGLICTEVL